MNSKERIMGAVSFREHDRVPVMALGRQVLMKMEGVGYTRNSLCDTEAVIRTEINGWKRFGYDVVSSKIYYPLEEDIFGACIQESPDGFPSVCPPHVVNTPPDLDKIRGESLLTHKHILAERAVVERLVREVGGEVPVLGYCQGPLRLAGQLRGLEPIMIDMIENKGFLHALLKKTTDVSYFRAYSAIQGGATLLFIGEPVASGNLISPALYEEFGLPYHQELIRRIKEHAGVAIILHICGDTSRMIPELCRSGADILHVEKVSLKDAKAKAAGRVCLMGNIDPVNIMLKGSVQQVREAALDCLSEMKDYPAYILGPGCGLPGETPPENIHALIEAAHL